MTEPAADDLTTYETHEWSGATDLSEDECVACGVTWTDCDDYCRAWLDRRAQ